MESLLRPGATHLWLEFRVRDNHHSLASRPAKSRLLPTVVGVGAILVFQLPLCSTFLARKWTIRLVAGPQGERPRRPLGGEARGRNRRGSPPQHPPGLRRPWGPLVGCFRPSAAPWEARGRPAGGTPLPLHPLLSRCGSNTHGMSYKIRCVSAPY